MSNHEPTMTGTKVCTKCNKELPVICFGIRKLSKDGLRSRCKSCTSEDNKKYNETIIKPRKKQVIRFTYESERE